MSKLRRVAVVMQSFTGVCRAVLRGVTSYAERVRNWELQATPLEQIDEEILRQAMLLDGLITWVSPDHIDILRGATAPAVAVHYCGDLQIPRVTDNPESIANMAVEHFCERGFRNFGFLATRSGFSQDRLTFYEQGLTERGYSCHHYQVPRIEPHLFGWHRHDEKPVEWLRSLPKPIGILTANDHLALQLLLSARHAGVRVPDDMAVLGVDNDDLVCHAATPQLSSIDNHGERIGWEAANLLDRQMNGESLGQLHVKVEPRRLMIRQSSDVYAVKDPNVAGAVRFIRENASRHLSVEDVVHTVAVARRTLERGFRNLLGRSIYDEIAESRIRLARQLLMDTDMGLTDITAACGFNNRTHLNAAFRKRSGHSPAAFRRAFRKLG